ncbi:unnamed protein product, partial [Owenia fusiformis]
CTLVGKQGENKTRIFKCVKNCMTCALVEARKRGSNLHKLRPRKHVKNCVMCDVAFAHGLGQIRRKEAGYLLMMRQCQQLRCLEKITFQSQARDIGHHRVKRDSSKEGDSGKGKQKGKGKGKEKSTIAGISTTPRLTVRVKRDETTGLTTPKPTQSSLGGYDGMGSFYGEEQVPKTEHEIRATTEKPEVTTVDKHHVTMTAESENNGLFGPTTEANTANSSSIEEKDGNSSDYKDTTVYKPNETTSVQELETKPTIDGDGVNQPTTENSHVLPGMENNSSYRMTLGEQLNQIEMRITSWDDDIGIQATAIVVSNISAVLSEHSDVTNDDLDKVLALLDIITRTSKSNASLETGKNIINIANLMTAQFNKIGQNTPMAAKLLDVVERMFLKIAETKTTFEHISRDSVVSATIQQLTMELNKHPQMITRRLNPSVSVSLDPRSFLGQSVTLASIVYEGLEDVLPVSIDTNRNGTKEVPIYTLINSNIVSLSITGAPNTVDLKAYPMSITMEKSVRFSNGTELCVFWNFNSDSWSTDGCFLGTNTSDTHTECVCSHLTNFAVLMQFNDAIEITKFQQRALMIISITGCCLSIICLIITVAVYIRYKLVIRSERIMIHTNLACSLCIGQFLFLFSELSTTDWVLCKVVAFLLHFFFMATFSWMLIEGVQLYVKSIKIFAHSYDTRVIFLFVGWLIPSVVVISSFGVKHSGYGISDNSLLNEEANKSCWLSTKDGTIWAFVGPAMAVMAFNFLITGLVIRVFLTLKANSEKSTYERLRAGLKAIVMLQPLLGLTWLFGLLGSISSDTVIFQYLFAICNSLQGVFIFILHCVSNDEVTKAYNKRQRSIMTSTSVVLDTDPSQSASVTTNGKFISLAGLGSAAVAAFRLGRQKSRVNNSSNPPLQHLHSDNNIEEINLNIDVCKLSMTSSRQINKRQESKDAWK